MSEDITVVQMRAGVQVYPKPFVVQLDKMDVREATYYKGADPHFTYTCFTTDLPISDPLLVRADDLLIDQNVTDPITQQKRQFRIRSEPEPLPDYHWEWVADRYRGT